MEAAEIARQFAAKLHRDAVARGLDPWKPYAFAVAEANRRDIDVEAAGPGATILGNSRATFIQADQLIVHENIGSLFDQAFLVAHEIGHSELGDDAEAGPPTQIDPARSAEPSPVGVDRVVDYEKGRCDDLASGPPVSPENDGLGLWARIKKKVRKRRQ
jgi:hypothetical protein